MECAGGEAAEAEGELRDSFCCYPTKIHATSEDKSENRIPKSEGDSNVEIAPSIFLTSCGNRLISRQHIASSAIFFPAS